MKKRTFALVVAVFCGTLLLLSTVCCIVTKDETLIVGTALFGGLYVFYIVKLIGVLKKQKTAKAQTVSPLAGRRR